MPNAPRYCFIYRGRHASARRLYLLPAGLRLLLPGEVLPEAALGAVHLLGGHHPELRAVPLGIELGEFAVHEGVEPGDVRAHAVGGQLLDGYEEAVRLPGLTALEVQPPGVQ